VTGGLVGGTLMGGYYALSGKGSFSEGFAAGAQQGVIAGALAGLVAGAVKGMQVASEAAKANAPGGGSENLTADYSLVAFTPAHCAVGIGIIAAIAIYRAYRVYKLRNRITDEAVNRIMESE